jgi:hypothetical protein
MVDDGIGGFYAERAGGVNGPGYDDLKFGSETVADPSQDGFGVGRQDEGVKGGVFLNCNIASLTQNVYFSHPCGPTSRSKDAAFPRGQDHGLLLPG